MNKPATKAIILDLDGTLLRSDGSISDYTLSVLERCRTAGIYIIVATARFWFKAEKYLNIIQPDYAILADGTQVYRGGKMICGFPMSTEQSAGIISELILGNFVASTGKSLLCSQPDIDEPWRKSFDFSVEPAMPVFKVAAFMDSADEAQALAKRYSCRMYSYRDENFYGYTSIEAGKYQSVCTLAEIIGIELRDTIAFGDDENDYEVIMNCGKGVAVANAIESIREIADAITGSNDEDGVAAYLERAILR